MTKEEGLEGAIVTVFEREQAYEEAVTNAAIAEHDYKLKHAEEYLKADGTVDERKAKALKASANLHKNYLTTDAIRTFTREKLKDAQDVLSARQSLLSYEARTNFGYANNAT